MDGRSVLYTFFLTGEKPTQGQFADLIASCFNLVDDTMTIADVENLASTLALLATSSALTAEITRAEGAEAALGTDITTETTRAEAAETTLAASIAAETTRAEGVEATKVNTEAGFGLSSNDYTSAEKTKLANLSDFFVGVFASAAALNAAYPTGSNGDYAVVESLGTDAVQYIWDGINNLWVPGGTGSVTSVNSQTGAVSLDTDNIGEGSTNLYFTAARVLATLLNGYTSGAGTISASDSVLSAIQKLNGNIAAIPGGSSSTSTPTADASAAWDDNVNFSANSFIEACAFIASDNGDTYLTVDSPSNQFITGTTGQTINLPDTSTCVIGQPYNIANISTGTTTIRNFLEEGTIVTLMNEQVAVITCISTTVNDNTAWNYYIVGAATASLTNNNTWNGTNTYTNEGTAITVENGNLSVTTGNMLASGVYATYKTGMSYAINTGGSTYGGIGNTSIDNEWALGYNTAGVQSAFLGVALRWNSYNQVIFGGTAQLSVYTVATLPSTNLEQGQMASVSDALAPTYLGTLTGGGSTFTPVIYNGAAWVSY